MQDAAEPHAVLEGGQRRAGWWLQRARAARLQGLRGAAALGGGTGINSASSQTKVSIGAHGLFPLSLRSSLQSALRW